MVQDSFCSSNLYHGFLVYCIIFYGSKCISSVTKKTLPISQQKYILFQPPKGFPDPAGRGSQIHSDMAGPAERPSVLPADTHIPACFQQLFNGHSRLFTVFRAVQENHIRSLRHGNIHSAEVFPDKVHGIAGVLLKNRPQFFKPLTALRL